MDHGHAAAGEAEGSRSARLQAMHSMQQHQQQLRQGANAHGQVHHGGYGGPSAHDGHGEQQQHRYGGDNAWFSDLDVLEYLLAPGQGDGHGGAGNSAAGGAHAGGSGRAPGNTHGLKRGAPDGAAAAAVAAAAGAAAGTGAGGAETSAPPQRAEKKAKREKARRDRLNDKFADLAKLCVEVRARARAGARQARARARDARGVPACSCRQSADAPSRPPRTSAARVARAVCCRAPTLPRPPTRARLSRPPAM